MSSAFYARVAAMAKKKAAEAAAGPAKALAGVPLSARIVEATGAQPNKNSKVFAAMRQQGVSKTPELNRIINLPRRPHPKVDLTARYARPGGTMKLRPIQSAMLHDAERASGLVGADVAAPAARAGLEDGGPPRAAAAP
jgi:hypothetical protein